MPLAFNLSTLVLPPKNVQPEEGSAVVRRPSDTRPLSLKNTDNKTTAAVHVHALQPAHAEWTCHAQTGFVPDRQLTANIVELDSAASKT